MRPLSKWPMRAGGDSQFILNIDRISALDNAMVKAEQPYPESYSWLEMESSFRNNMYAVQVKMDDSIRFGNTPDPEPTFLRIYSFSTHHTSRSNSILSSELPDLFIIRWSVKTYANSRLGIKTLFNYIHRQRRFPRSRFIPATLPHPRTHFPGT
jgi:hypothetical protein